VGALEPGVQLLWRNNPALTEIELFSEDGMPTDERVRVPLDHLDTIAAHPIRRTTGRGGAGRARRGRCISQRLAILVLALGACSDPTEPDPRPGWELLPAILLHHGVPVAMVVPDTATRGVPFRVAFATFAPGCDERGDTTMRVTGSTVDVMPRDWTMTAPPPSCPDSIITVLGRAVAVQVDVAGPARIRIHGRREPEGTTVIFSATIDVR
jgi:hypothetical protein